MEELEASEQERSMNTKAYPLLHPLDSIYRGRRYPLP
jgi:hypothetical protein